MLTLAWLGVIQIRLYAKDHMPPHFHISTPDGEAMTLISDLSLLKGRLRRRELETVRRWATENRDCWKMSGSEPTDDDEFVEVDGPLPRIRNAEQVEDMKVRVEWDDGREEIIDLKPAVMSHRHFVALRNDPKSFAAFKVRDRGDSLVWPNGQELSASWIAELAPTTLDNVEFRQAMDDLRLSLDGMAARLGIARRLVADYRKDKPIPQAIALATKYLVDRQRKAG
jgi:hypothetical protein